MSPKSRRPDSSTTSCQSNNVSFCSRQAIDLLCRVVTASGTTTGARLGERLSSRVSIERETGTAAEPFAARTFPVTEIGLAAGNNSIQLSIPRLEKSGREIANLPTWLIFDALNAGRLEAVWPGREAEGSDIHLLWPAAREPLLKVRVIIDALVAQFDKAPDGGLGQFVQKSHPSKLLK